MFRFLLLLALSGNFVLKGQNLRIGVLGQASLNYYTIQTYLSSLSQDFKQQHKPITTFSGGPILFKDLTNSVAFVTGLLFAQRGLKSQYNTNNITAFNFSNSGYDLKIIDRYIEIPLLLNIKLNRQNWISFFGSFGLKPSFYLNSISKVVGSYSTSSRYYYNGYRKFNFFASLGFGADIKFNDRFSFVIWPSLDHALISEVYAAPLKLYPYSAGINLCLVYSLGN